MTTPGLAVGVPVVLYLHNPKEKIWGVLLGLDPAGIVVRGVDLVVFDDWMRQEAHGDDPLIGPSTLFYPMNRVERMERDESYGPVVGYADRFAREVGRTVDEALGLRGESGTLGQPQ